MDPMTLGVIAVVAFLAMSGSKKQTEQQPATPPPAPSGDGMQNWVGEVGTRVSDGISDAARGTMGLIGRFKDQVNAFGASNTSNSVQENGGGASGSDGVAFKVFMSGAAGPAYQIGSFVAGKAANTETGKAVQAEIDEGKRKAEAAAKAAADAAAQAGRDADKALAKAVRGFF